MSPDPQIVFAVDRTGQPIRMPPSLIAAQGLQIREPHVFCRSCGDELVWVLGSKRAPHFRHRPDAVCTYGEHAIERDIESHRHVQHLLGEWAGRKGWAHRAEVRVGDDGARTDFELNAGEFTGRIEVQRAEIGKHEWSSRTVAYHRGSAFVEWLWEQADNAGATYAARFKPALVYALNEDADALMLAGATAGRVETEFIPLDKWSVTPRGFTHPVLASIPRHSGLLPSEQARPGYEALMADQRRRGLPERFPR